MDYVRILRVIHKKAFLKKNKNKNEYCTFCEVQTE